MTFIPESEKATEMLKRVESLIFPFSWGISARQAQKSLVLVFPCSNSSEGKIQRRLLSTHPKTSVTPTFLCPETAIIQFSTAEPLLATHEKNRPQEPQPTSGERNPSGIPAGTSRPRLGSAAGAGRGRTCSPGHLWERKTPAGQWGLAAQPHIPRDPSCREGEGIPPPQPPEPPPSPTKFSFLTPYQIQVSTHSWHCHPQLS